MKERPDPASFDPPEVRRRHAAMVAHAFRLVGPWHRRALAVHRACSGDVYLVNPMSNAANMVLRIMPEAITIAMDEADVPKSQRAETRAVVKMIHAIESGSRPAILDQFCMGSGCGEEPVEEWREVCQDGSRCACKSWWSAFAESEAA